MVMATPGVADLVAACPVLLHGEHEEGKGGGEEVLFGGLLSVEAVPADAYSPERMRKKNAMTVMSLHASNKGVAAGSARVVATAS